MFLSQLFINVICHDKNLMTMEQTGLKFKEKEMQQRLILI